MNEIFLSDDLAIQNGNERICFRHPSDDALCIKVTKKGRVHRLQNKVEKFYYELLMQKNTPFDYIARYYGPVNTNYGIGLVFEKVCNDDLTLSKSLSESISLGLINRSEAKEILNNVYQYLYQNGIYLGDLNQDQILLAQKSGVYVPKIIDGLGTRRYGFKLLVLTRFKFIARRKLKKNWPVLINKIFT